MHNYIKLTDELKRYMLCYQYIYLVNIPEPTQYYIYTMAFLFDLRCESVTYVTIQAFIRITRSTVYVTEGYIIEYVV